MGSFGAVDYVIFIGTLAVSLFIGIYYAFFKKQTTNRDLLVGGRSIGVFPIALSLLATYMSAILVLGFAGELYSHGSLITIMILGSLVFIPLGGALFMPTLYRLELTSAYEVRKRDILIDRIRIDRITPKLRFQSRVVRCFASGTFIVQILLYMGVVLFAPSLALHAVVPEFPIWASIITVGASAAVYTSIGGIKV